MTQDSMLQQNVIKQVAINPVVMDAWVDAISDVAMSFRLKQQMKPVHIEHDSAFIAPTGSLTIVTTVEGEPLRMVVPREMWSWQKPLPDQGL